MNDLNVEPRTIFCRDNIDVLRGINSNCIDLIYLDPPFNKKKTFSAPIGSSAEGAEFNDLFREEDIKSEWVQEIQQEYYELHSLLNGIKEFSNPYNYCYSVYMAIRLLEMYRILKSTGSIYLHCDPTMSHYLKLIMDCIFGEKNFRNEIVWWYSGPNNTKKYFPRKHDIIFFYVKDQTKSYIFNHNDIRTPYSTAFLERRLYAESKGGRGIMSNYTSEKRTHEDIDEQWSNGKIPPSVWNEFYTGGQISSKERTGYPTQKPIALLERIIQASSNKNDIILDPFCGCATTCVAAEKLDRQWIGIDVSQKAYELVKIRLNKEVPLDLFHGEPNFTTIPPKRTDNNETGKLHGYVYIISNKAFKKSLKVGIARNPESRLNNYQTSDPKRGYVLEKAYQTPFNVEIEKMVHEYYNSPEEWVATNNVEEVYNLILEFDKQLKNQK